MEDSLLSPGARARGRGNSTKTLLRAIYDAMACGVTVHGLDGAVVQANRAAQEILGSPLDRLLGWTPLDPPWHALSPDGSERPGTAHPAIMVLHTGRPVRGETLGVRLPGGGFRWLQVDAVPSFDEAGQLREVISSFTDITARVQIEAELAYRASHDALTDLPNRTLFHERLERALGEGSALAVLLLDLDRFKEVNDTFGHHQGDLLLRCASERLRGAVGTDGTVARFGGDEFAVLLPAADCPAAVGAANAIRALLDDPFIAGGQSLHINASIGVALGGGRSEQAETLVRRADVAMYAAKRRGEPYAVYAPDLDSYTPERVALIEDLRSAIRMQRLALHYQPKVSIATGQVTCVEALSRWAHPSRGAIPPNQFIPLAEQAGLLVPLARWALGAALRQAGAWSDAGLPLTVAVNLSTADLLDPELPAAIDGMLRAHGLSPERLRLEVTESTLMADPERARAVLARLASAGVGISVDDYGSGYSSLAYLKHLPVDELKIDMSFVRHMTEDTADAIVRSTVDLGHNLGLRVVAEGVEDRQAWEMLAAMGCDIAQGYYLARPLPADEIAPWIRGSMTSIRATAG